MGVQSPAGLRWFVAAEGIVGGLLMAFGSIGTFALLSFAISQTPPPADNGWTLANACLFYGAAPLGMSLFAAAVGLAGRQAWGVYLGLASQGGLLAIAGLVLAAKWAPVLTGMACGAALIGFWYLTKPEFSTWTAEAQAPAAPPTVMWLRTGLLVGAYVQLGALLASPIAVPLMGLASGFGGWHPSPDPGVLALMLLWLALLLGLELWFRRASEKRGGAAVPGHLLAGAIALGALLPWIGWLWLVPILAAAGLEVILLTRPSRDWVHG
jgi:hypothetical protein